MRVMYHYDNTDKINSVLLVLKKFKGLKNEIINLYLYKFNDVMGYATGPRQYPLYYDLELVLLMKTHLPLTQRAQAPLRQHKY